MVEKKFLYGAAGVAIGYYFLPGFIGLNPLLLAAGSGAVLYMYGPDYIGL